MNLAPADAIQMLIPSTDIKEGLGLLPTVCRPIVPYDPVFGRSPNVGIPFCHGVRDLFPYLNKTRHLERSRTRWIRPQKRGRLSSGEKSADRETRRDEIGPTALINQCEHPSH